MLQWRTASLRFGLESCFVLILFFELWIYAICVEVMSLLSLQARLKDSLVSSLQFSRVGDQELAWIDGIIDKSESVPIIDCTADKASIQFAVCYVCECVSMCLYECMCVYMCVVRELRKSLCS